MADFEKNHDGFRELDARVLAASVDAREDAEGTVEKHGLSYPVAYGLDAREMAETIGCYIDEDRGFMHATGVVLRPDGTVSLVVYSSGSIGRLVARDTRHYIEFHQDEG